MKTKITTIVLMLFFLSFSSAQNLGLPLQEGGERNSVTIKSPCLTIEQRDAIKQELKSNVEALQRQNKLAYDANTARGGHPLFIWPVQKASTVTYNDVWSISGHVDHNLAFNNNLLDYNGGTKTYDTSDYNHQGLDIFTWPFTWHLMETDGVEIVAAAPGQIIAKGDGNFDKSCNFNTTTPWNAVYVQHNDGSVAWYGHMKNGSTTTKNVGDMVTAGEYLGIVGSSGISTGPHLHFEVYTDNSYTQLVDPYQGAHNSMNNDTWWANQKPYVNPKINAVLTHNEAPIVFPNCPTTETPNLSNTFDTNDTVFFTVFVRDQTAGDNITLEILRPDNSSLFGNWNITVQTTATYWYYLYSYNGYFNMNGDWTWKATFGGETVSHTFNVSGALSVNDEAFKDTSIYPNPCNDIVNINSTTKITKANVVDVLGKTVHMVDDMAEEGIKKLNLTQLSKGLYFVTLEGEQDQKKTIKLIKK
ncbi:peptidoglycan DD-metalloendopeptidase family protein [Winogradskyella schleiferi]|uniref:peptidoglycan DD-metalloendopeptidase family protein n=1 Tax=Winogradskyella schleiferi TaxID=2686078 RepID=UPI0015BA3917|nr:peptidoglycan DD-metalloendopeptidase family protein [Winogradskyella schleiferi]